MNAPPFGLGQVVDPSAPRQVVARRCCPAFERLQRERERLATERRSGTKPGRMVSIRR